MLKNYPNIFSPSLLEKRRLITMSPINTKIHKTGITYWGKSVTGTNEREGEKEYVNCILYRSRLMISVTKPVRQQVKTNINSFWNQNTTVQKCLELFHVPEVSTESPSSLINLKQPSWSRILSSLVRSNSWSHNSFKANACGTWGVQVSLWSRVK